MSTVSTSLRHTTLASRHKELGARMVDFHGWEMPVHYGSQIDEHLAVRTSAGMFDVSHMCVVDVHGNEARAFLQTMFANNVDKLKTPGKALYTCMLNPQGGIKDDLIVYYLAENSYRLIVNAGRADDDLQWLSEHAQQLAPSIEIIPRRIGQAADPATALAIIAVQGPQARARTWEALPGLQQAAEGLKPFHSVDWSDPVLGSIMVARTGYTGEDGHEILVAAGQAQALWNRLIEVGVMPAGLGARDTLRLEAGLNLYGQDMDETTLPFDCGLGWTVDMESSRDFIGKPALLQHQARFQMAGLVALERTGVFRADQAVTTPQGEGRITSGTFSPTLQQSIALAQLPKGVEFDSVVSVVVRGKAVPARVVRLPFVRHGKVLI